MLYKRFWRLRRDLNPRPLPWQGSVLTNWTTQSYWATVTVALCVSKENGYEYYVSLVWKGSRMRAHIVQVNTASIMQRLVNKPFWWITVISVSDHGKIIVSCKPVMENTMKGTKAVRMIPIMNMRFSFEDNAISYHFLFQDCYVAILDVGSLLKNRHSQSALNNYVFG